MASKRRNMFQKDKTQETTENGATIVRLSGRKFTVFAIVSPYEKKWTPIPEERPFDTYILSGGSKHYDGRAYGFPFDRKIPSDALFHHMPNAAFQDVLVYHKEEAEINRMADH
ncbi:hypothetical protein AAG570_002553 [Ranatra chinensis]|uniref:Hemocyanin C-terminal domain-containing protein n=1 Tax=Ranatra chinensis TaxID=642074 RepID=A0ABD0YUK4_9HEMI